uniref:Secreted protein n=1 Tax=Esox lucius TaxID=8010 RepID=A0AAY5KDZ9_ESOLU
MLFTSLVQFCLTVLFYFYSSTLSCLSLTDDLKTFLQHYVILLGWSFKAQDTVLNVLGNRGHDYSEVFGHRWILCFIVYFDFK